MKQTVILKLKQQITGKKLYENYCEFTNNKSLISGDQLPVWEDLPEKVRGAWNFSCKKLLDELAI